MIASRALPILALALAAPAPAQQDGRDGPQAVDVHVLELVTQADEFVPVVRIIEAQRLPVDGAEHAMTVRKGALRISVEVRGGSPGSVELRRQLGRSTRSDPLASAKLDLTDPWRWGRRPRGGRTQRAAVLCEPVRDASREFRARDPKAFLQRAVDLLFDEEPVQFRFEMRGPLRQQSQGAFGTRGMAATLLGSVPLREYLPRDQIDRILERGGTLPASLEDPSWPYLRPLVALGHGPTLAALVHLDDEADVPDVPRSIEDAVLIAYATAQDPALRGLAGWVATGTRSKVLCDDLIEAVQAGRAVLPGDEPVRLAREAHLVDVRAWQSVSPPALTLAGSAAVIALVMMILRALARRAV